LPLWISSPKKASADAVCGKGGEIPTLRAAPIVGLERALELCEKVMLLAHSPHQQIVKLINRKTGRIETAQEWLGHSSTAHTRAYIDAEDIREKANGVVAALDI